MNKEQVKKQPLRFLLENILPQQRFTTEAKDIFKNFNFSSNLTDKLLRVK